MTADPESRKSVRSWRFRLLLFLAVFGIGYIFLTPPLEAPDEAAHFARAYGLSEGQWILKDHPRYLVAYIAEYLRASSGGRPDPLLEEIERLLKAPGQRIPNLAYNTALYCPLPYLFFAGVIKVVGWARQPVPVETALYFCRGTSLLLFLACVLAAFLLMPEHAWTVFWIAATPMALSQAAAVSIDGIVLGGSMLIFTLPFGFGDRTGRTWALALAGLMVVLAKTPYAAFLLVPVGALIFLRDRPPGLAAARTLAAVSVAVAGGVLWAWIVSQHDLYQQTARFITRFTGLEIDPAVQLREVVETPLKFAATVWHTFDDHGGALWHQFVGVLGHLDRPLPRAAAWGWGLLAPAALFAAGQRSRWDRLHAVGIGSVFLVAGVGAFAGICLGAYLIWMPLGSGWIHLQGRYFHAVVLALMIGVGWMIPHPLGGRARRALRTVVLVAAAGINLTAFYLLGFAGP